MKTQKSELQLLEAQLRKTIYSTLFIPPKLCKNMYLVTTANGKISLKYYSNSSHALNSNIGFSITINPHDPYGDFMSGLVTVKMDFRYGIRKIRGIHRPVSVHDALAYLNNFIKKETKWLLNQIEE